MRACPAQAQPALVWTCLYLRLFFSATRPPSIAPPQDVVVALYNCTADDAEDLAFAQGDRIHVLERMDGDWWRGRRVDAVGRAIGPPGVFPRTYVS